jgi:hypothetical protein
MGQLSELVPQFFGVRGTSPIGLQSLSLPNNYRHFGQ